MSNQSLYCQHRYCNQILKNTRRDRLKSHVLEYYRSFHSTPFHQTVLQIRTFYRPKTRHCNAPALCVSCCVLRHNTHCGWRSWVELRRGEIAGQKMKRLVAWNTLLLTVQSRARRRSKDKSQIGTSRSLEKKLLLATVSLVENRLNSSSDWNILRCKRHCFSWVWEELKGDEGGGLLRTPIKWVSCLQKK